MDFIRNRKSQSVRVHVGKAVSGYIMAHSRVRIDHIIMLCYHQMFGQETGWLDCKRLRRDGAVINDHYSPIG
jgi:hypothetical protein